MKNNIAPMPTQNPWAWALMGVGVGAQCWSLMFYEQALSIHYGLEKVGVFHLLLILLSHVLVLIIGLSWELLSLYMNLMAGPHCPPMHWFSHKARVDIKNSRLKAIKAALSLS